MEKLDNFAGNIHHELDNGPSKMLDDIMMGYNRSSSSVEGNMTNANGSPQPLDDNVFEDNTASDLLEDSAIKENGPSELVLEDTTLEQTLKEQGDVQNLAKDTNDAEPLAKQQGAGSPKGVYLHPYDEPPTCSKNAFRKSKNGVDNCYPNGYLTAVVEPETFDLYSEPPTCSKNVYPHLYGRTEDAENRGDGRTMTFNVEVKEFFPAGLLNQNANLQHAEERFDLDVIIEEEEDLLDTNALGDGPANDFNMNDEDQRNRGDGSQLAYFSLHPDVVDKVSQLRDCGKVVDGDLDSRAMDALRDLPVKGALNVLDQFMEANLEHVSNKSAYLCSIMKTYKELYGIQSVPTTVRRARVYGPDQDKIRDILLRTGYELDVTPGQRKYGGPPPNWDGTPPGNGCEVFCGKIPKDLFEDELIPLFERYGTIWDLRLMMNPITGLNRGYAFITYTTRESAMDAVCKLDDFVIKPGKLLKLNLSVPNMRLFVGNIPKAKCKEEIFDEFQKLADGLRDVIIYNSPDERKKNRGFCFLEYETHKAASLAKRRLGTGRVRVWKCEIIVDWADPQDEPDAQVMSQVKVLYVRNLTQDVTEEALKELFDPYGNVERVKKIKDYAFVHFEDRDSAELAMQDLNGLEFGGSTIEITIAKPPIDKKKREGMLRARERRMHQLLNSTMAEKPAANMPTTTIAHMRMINGAGLPQHSPIVGGAGRGVGYYAPPSTDYLPMHHYARTTFYPVARNMRFRSHPPPITDSHMPRTIAVSHNYAKTYQHTAYMAGIYSPTQNSDQQQQLPEYDTPARNWHI